MTMLQDTGERTASLAQKSKGAPCHRRQIEQVVHIRSGQMNRARVYPFKDPLVRIVRKTRDHLKLPIHTSIDDRPRPSRNESISRQGFHRSATNNITKQKRSYNPQEAFDKRRVQTNPSEQSADVRHGRWRCRESQNRKQRRNQKSRSRVTATPIPPQSPEMRHATTTATGRGRRRRRADEEFGTGAKRHAVESQPGWYGRVDVRVARKGPAFAGRGGKAERSHRTNPIPCTLLVLTVMTAAERAQGFM
ncbi:hypothetical protein AXG93_4689s1360 [Marchantia polymorpha subsp. ruderalis]|uniref:Uncharacterized protein n=1 Tax=Marchantia polymorpha subsp. ruderalis TaxID=1480154 RepID=A0A176WKS5_MARPO|nr:hypothetical protein AXG93_4689s1360 [Marchantia polymorpha subsp. ruderalis]